MDERSARKDEADKEHVKFLRELARNQDHGGLFICYLYVDADVRMKQCRLMTGKRPAG